MPKVGEISKGRAAKPLPTPRVAFSKQMEIIRAYGAACGNAPREVTNKEVADIVSLKPDTVALANGFLSAIGLLSRDDKGYTPSSEVMAFCRAYEWTPETASHKLAPALERTWFHEVLIPRLRFRPMTETDAITELADAASVTPDYKPQLEMLLEFMIVGGLIVRDNGSIKLARPSPHAEGSKPKVEQPLQEQGKEHATERVHKPVQSEGTVDFPLYFKGKPAGVIRVPQDLSEEDCHLIELTIPVIKAYAAQGEKAGAPERRTP